ncbi:hypothetical protein PT2222_310076 [Paraburkholderia tropica]
MASFVDIIVRLRFEARSSELIHGIHQECLEIRLRTAARRNGVDGRERQHGMLHLQLLREIGLVARAQAVTREPAVEIETHAALRARRRFRGGLRHRCSHTRTRRFGRAKQLLDELLAREQRRTVDPRHAAGPAFHIGRIKQILAERRRGPRERRGVAIRHAEAPNRTDDERHRRTDQHAAIALVPERRRKQQSAQRSGNIVTTRAKMRGDVVELRGIGRVGHELAPHFRRHEMRRLWLAEQNVEHRVAIERAAVAEHGLHAVVVLRRPRDELPGIGVDGPARVGARRLGDVLLRVLPFAEREQLHDLAREVLVRLALAIARAVEIEQHRRIFRHLVQHCREIAERVAPQERILLGHHLGLRHLVLTRREMVMPEQRHALRDRRRRDQHLAHPPRAQFVVMPAARTLRVAALIGRPGVALGARRQRLGAPGGQLRDGLGAGGGQHAVDGFGAREADVRREVGAGRCEARADQQMPRVVSVEQLGFDGRRHRR